MRRIIGSPGYFDRLPDTTGPARFAVYDRKHRPLGVAVRRFGNLRGYFVTSTAWEDRRIVVGCVRDLAFAAALLEQYRATGRVQAHAKGLTRDTCTV